MVITERDKMGKYIRNPDPPAGSRPEPTPPPPSPSQDCASCDKRDAADAIIAGVAYEQALATIQRHIRECDYYKAALTEIADSSAAGLADGGEVPCRRAAIEMRHIAMKVLGRLPAAGSGNK